MKLITLVLGLFLSKIPVKDFYQKNQKSVLSLYAAVILCKKSEKLNTYFIKHEKLKKQIFFEKRHLGQFL